MNGKQLKNSILQWAIQGKLVPQDPNDEPASVLLERIREEKARLVKEKKIKKDKNESIIFRGDDNSHYEKFADGTVKCIDDEIPFEIPQSWCWVRLGQVLTVKGGKRIPLGDSFAPGPTAHIYIRVTEMKNHTLVDNNLKYVSDSVFEKIKNYTISKNDLYLTIAGTIGSVGIVPEKFDGMSLTENAVKLTNILIDNMFLVYGISSQFVQSQFVEKTKQMAQPKLAIERILTTLIPLPPLNEQNSIVSRLEQILPIVAKYEKSQEALDKLNAEIFDKLKKSVLQEAVQGRLVPQDPNDEPASVLLERIKEEKAKLFKEGKLKKKDLVDSVIFKGDDNKYYETIDSEVTCIDDEIPFEIPDRWAWARGKTIFMPMQSTKPTGESFTYIDVDAVNNRKNIIDNAKCVLTSTAPSRATRKVWHNSILFSMVRPYLKNIALVGKEYCNAIASTGFYVIRPSMHLYPEYIFQLMLSTYVVDGLNKFMKGDNSPSINNEHIEEFLYPIPPANEQQRIICKLYELLPIMK